MSLASFWISRSAFSSQYVIPSSRYIIATVARCSRASQACPLARPLIVLRVLLGAASQALPRAESERQRISLTNGEGAPAEQALVSEPKVTKQFSYGHRAWRQIAPILPNKPN